ncbi:glutathione S-transferase family protein [Pseudomaricurvus alcaniphilus]|uniref:glutathione S-transferase family protein n=1 Tax=Pseudomaricurvus alcaniphilus TaxID=1166482 RepID=UPI0014072D6A|nr:glutathione S-transferase family protein [Pseudomaricurvus alcaniphilus]NHN39896.1 glutathione S-transferase family protein [Pseudomaricurvus alcaniphilus]
MLELFHTPQSTCSQKVRLVLAEKSLDWTERKIDWLNGEHLQDWYLKINPNGVVPTLVHNGSSVVDSSVINEYLEDVFPTPSLRPQDPLECARMRSWRQYIDEVPTTAIRFPSFNKILVNLWKNMSDEEFEQFAKKHPLRADFYRRMGTTGFNQDDINSSKIRLTDALNRMEASLSQGNPWLNGELFSLIDISILPTIVRMEDLGMSDMWSELPNVTDWYTRIQKRPSFEAAYQGETRQLPSW